MAGIRADQVALYTKDMYKAEREGYKQADTMWDKIFMVKNGVTGAGDKQTQILGAGALTRHTAENQQIVFKSPIQGWEYLVRYWTYSDGIALSKEAVEDTVKLGNLLKELAATWGISNRVEHETLAATVFNRGGDLLGEYVFNGTHTNNTDSSGDMMYDSEPLFNLTGNTRSTKGGGTYFNSVAGIGTPSAANFETIYNRHTTANNRDERDRVVKNPADTVICDPGGDKFLFERILNTPKEQGLPGSQNNDINPYYGIIKNIFDWDYLDDDAFYVGKAASPAFQFHQRQLPEIRFFRDETNLGYKASFNQRMGILLRDWRVWSRAGGSSA